MGHLVPSIAFVQKTIQHYENGLSLIQTLQLQTKSSDSDFSLKMATWFKLYQAGEASFDGFKTSYQLAFIEILEMGLSGSPVHGHLLELEEEMSSEFEHRWKSYLEQLPLRLSLPLLLFFFPAYLILLFGPLFIQLTKGFQI